jgi:hypothetical protein
MEMAETLRIERVTDAILGVMKGHSRKAWKVTELQDRVYTKVSNLREGDFRAAIWQLIDAGEIRVTEDHRLIKVAAALAQ